MYFNVDADINVHGPGSSAERTEYCKTWQEKERDRQYYKQRLEKWEKQQATTELKSETFKGVTVWISGYTDKASDLQLKTLVAQHGGQISWFFSATRTTHIVCTNLAAAKIDRMLKRVGAKRFIPVVHPDWILNSVKQRKLLPEHDFRVIQPTNQHQIDQFFTKKTDDDIDVDDEEDSMSDSIAENVDKPKIIPRPIYSPKKTYSTTLLKLSPKKEKKQIINESKSLDNSDSNNSAKNAVDKNKENFVPDPIGGVQEMNNNNNNNTKKDNALKNIDIRTGKVIKTSPSVVHAKKSSSNKPPLAKLSLLANGQFKNIPNVAKKSGPVKK